MNCPIDKSAMIVLELDEVEIDYCLECKGIWLDAGELELLLGDADITEALMSSIQSRPKSIEKKRKCPICSRKMDKIICGEEEKFLIDECRNRHGLWLDHGELELLMKAGGLDDDHRINNLLKDMFGQKQ